MNWIFNRFRWTRLLAYERYLIYNGWKSYQFFVNTNKMGRTKNW